MKNKMNKLIATLCLIVLAGVINSILFNVTLEDMAKDLNVTNSSISWIVISYTLVITFGSVTYSKLASYFQIKNLLIFGVIMVTLGSLIGYFSSSYMGVLSARIIQAIGGSSFITLSMITANRFIPVSMRNFALALIGGCLSLGSGLGFLVGGILTLTWGWHSLFLLISLTFLTVFGIYTLLPSGYANKERITEPFDILGLFYIVLFVTSFILGVKLSSFLLFLSILSLFLLGFHSKKKRRVLFIDLSVLKSFSFNKLLLISFINNAAMVAILFLYPSLMNSAFHLSSVGIGFIICVGSIISFLISLMIRKLVRSMSNEILMFISIVIQMISFCILTFFGMTSIIMAILGLFLIYTCYSILTVIINQEIPHYVEQDKASMGFGIYNLINFLGMSFGPTMSSRILGIHSNFSFVLQSFTLLLIVSLLFMLVGRRKVNTQIKRS